VLPLTEPFSEKYLKKLIGRTDIEDALKRLDRLTQEETRMAAAQVLKVANTVDDRVRVVDDKIAAVIDGTQHIFKQSSENCLANNTPRWNRGQGSYATSGRRRRSNETFVTFESR
jgi:hypothetical protein